MKETFNDIIFSEDEYGLFVKKDEDELKLYAGYYMQNKDKVYLISERKLYNIDKVADVFKTAETGIYRARIPSFDIRFPFKEIRYFGLFYNDKYFSNFEFLFDKKNKKSSCSLSLLCKNEKRINNDIKAIKNIDKELE